LNSFTEYFTLEIYKLGFVKFGSFKLSSGKVSPYYIDLRTLPSYPQLYKQVMLALARLIEETCGSFDVVAGIETSGIVHAAYLGCLTGKPVAYVRKKAKDHGLAKLVEGVVEGEKVVLVDDVSTTGNTLASAVEALRATGALVECAFVIVDRCEGAREKLEKIGVVLKPLITVHEIFSILEKNNLLDKTVVEAVRKYLERA